MNRSRRFPLSVAAIVLGLIALIGLPVTAGAHTSHGQAAKKLKAKSQKVSIGFTAVNGNQPVSCSKPITGLGTTSRSAKLTDLRFYVSGVRLLRKGGGAVRVKLPNGSKWSYTRGGAASTLIDLENGSGGCATEGTKAINNRVRGTVPRGRYVGVRYSVSVPRSINHTDVTTTPAPLNLTAMAWSWQAGRKFMKVELSEDSGPAWGSKIYFLHVGSTDCKGNPAAGEKTSCGLPNRNQVTLRKFNPAKQRIALDLKALFAGVDIAGGSGMGHMSGMGGMDDMPGMGEMGGCMSATSSADCAPIFESLGMKLGTKKRTAQTAFRPVRK